MNNITTCTLMAAFSHNLDCSLGALNELCPIEAQEAVMGIQVGLGWVTKGQMNEGEYVQEQLNDEAIARQCYQQQQQQNVEMDGEPTAQGPSANAKDNNHNNGSSSKLNGPQPFLLRPMHGGCTEAQEVCCWGKGQKCPNIVINYLPRKMPSSALPNWRICLAVCSASHPWAPSSPTIRHFPRSVPFLNVTRNAFNRECFPRALLVPGQDAP
jgi:hypothetical protein